MKKIGVLTLPTLTNYGGILQAYALVYVLKKLGYDAWLINRRWNADNHSILHRIKKVFYHLFVIRKFDKFCEEYIVPRTEEIDTRAKMDEIRQAGFDGYVVGSDQVWRIKNVRGADYNFFLDFAKDDHVKRISYAASFGVDYWDDNQNPEKSRAEVKPLLQKFDAISVREDSGVKVCKDCFDVPATHVLDPTLLIDKEEYVKNLGLKVRRKKYLAVYILDMTKEKKKIIKKISSELGLPIKYINYSSLLWKWMPSSISDIVKPDVKEWMQSILEADYVLTDSFHGMAFSIIFEKQFLVIGNERRGLTRFASLLKSLCINDNLVMDLDSIDISIVEKNLDYSAIFMQKKKLQKQSESFIVNNI